MPGYARTVEELGTALALQGDRYRQVNDGIHRAGDDREAYLCECLQPACNELVELTSAEYEAVRARPSRYFVRAGHARPDVDAVVERHMRYLVVERCGAAVAPAAVDV
jgi:hypothetical protein